GSYGPRWDLSETASEAWRSIAFKEGSIDTSNANPRWPQVVHELALGSEPNNPEASLNWTDVTDRVTEFSTRRGRDYELARTEAGEADVRMRNDDGFLNPGANEDVRVFTPYRVRAVWNGVSHSIFTGYVERWPQIWDNLYGSSPLVAVDGLATLSGTRLAGTLSNEIMLDDPYGYWPLDDGRLATEAANKARGNSETLRATDSATKGGSGFFGADLDLQGEESTCWEQTRYSTVSNSNTGVCLAGDVNLPS